MLATSCSASPSTSSRGGGGWVRPSKGLSWAGLSWETCHTGWTRRIPSGSRRMKDAGPAVPIISKGLRYLSASFREGCIIWINSACRKTLSPIVSGGAGVRAASAEDCVCSCVIARLSWRHAWTSERLVTNWCAAWEVERRSGYVGSAGWYPLLAKNGVVPVATLSALL